MSKKFDLEGLINRYMIHLWTQDYFDHTREFKLDTKEIDIKGIRTALAKKISSKNFPKPINIEKMIAEVLKNEIITFELVIDRIKVEQEKLSRDSDSVLQEEINLLKKIPDNELIYQVLANYNIRLKKSDYDNYTDFYGSLTLLHREELKELSLKEYNLHLTNKMADYLDEYSMAAKWDMNFIMMDEIRKYRKTKKLHEILKKQSMDLLKTIHHSDLILNNEDFSERTLLAGIIIKFLAGNEKWLERVPLIHEKSFSKWWKTVDFERKFIFEIHQYIQEHHLKFEDVASKTPKNEWIANFLNFMIRIKKKEWYYLGRKYPFNFPYRESGPDKIESAITEMKKQ